jgi:DNA-binding CsgD family transcriptional regulator
MAWLAARRLPPQERRWIGHHRAEDLLEAAYRQACYDDVGIRERVSVLVLRPTGQRAAVSFYRSLAQPEFDADDFRAVAVHAALLADAAAAHGRTTPAASRPPATPDAAPGLLALTHREREVIDRLLAGMTGEEAASDLGIRVTTVRTLQYRAFRRLGIRTVKDLLRGHAPPPA